VRDAQSRQLEHQPALRERPASVALCTRAADQSGARSCAAPEFVAQPPREAVQKNEAQPLELAGRQTQRLQAELREARTQEEPDAPQERSLAA
jgi:hypothetical protein